MFESHIVYNFYPADKDHSSAASYYITPAYELFLKEEEKYIIWEHFTIYTSARLVRGDDTDRTYFAILGFLAVLLAIIGIAKMGKWC